MNVLMKNILVIFGTRPEAIKLAPVILELRRHHDYKVTICNTEQQKELSSWALNFFGLRSDISLDCMTANQSLCEICGNILLKLEKVFTSCFDLVIVQGDTMSVLCGALAAFYHKIPIAYVESGLRSGDIFEPFPEEAIRQCVSRIATLHFAPSSDSLANLAKENIATNVYNVGNTSIDSLSLSR